MKKLIMNIMVGFLLSFYVISSAIASVHDENALIKNGYLLIYIPVNFYTLDPRASVSAHIKFIMPLIYEPLITIDINQNIKPGLANFWTVSNNKIIMNIRGGHKFSDGSLLTAADVVNSFVKLCSKDSPTAKNISSLIGCTGDEKSNPKVKFLNAHQVEFEINASATSFLNELAFSSALIFKLSDEKKLLGSGPYTINAMEKDKLILGRNKFNQLKDEKFNKGLIIKTVNDFDLKEKVIAERPDLAIMYRLYRKDNGANLIIPHYKVLPSYPLETEILVLNNQRYPFNSMALRRAIAFSIHKQQRIAACVPGGKNTNGMIPIGIGGSLANQAIAIKPMSPELVFHALPDLKLRPANITIHELFGIKNECEEKAIKRAFELYHVNAKFEYHAGYGDLWPKYLNHDLDGFVDNFVFLNRDALRIFRFFSEKAGNFANKQGSEISELIQKSLSSSNSAQRYKLYTLINKYLTENAIVIPLYYLGHNMVVSECVTGEISPKLTNAFESLPFTYRQSNCALPNVQS